MHQKEMTTEEEYTNYSLKQLDNWIHDALSTDATPKQIYDRIVDTIQENIDIYKKSMDKCVDLMSLLKGHRDIDLNDLWDTYNNMTQRKWTVPVEVDAASGEYFIMIPDEVLDQVDWEEGDTLEWIDLNDGSFELRKVNGTV